jgi:hypothetical protein
LFLSKELSVRETSYAYAGWRFAEHFLNRLGPEYSLLKEILEASKDDRCVVCRRFGFSFSLLPETCHLWGCCQNVRGGILTATLRLQERGAS